jgi:hypothetical protein
MQRFEPEARAALPLDYDAWVLGLGDVADTCGAWALIGAWRKSPTEYCRYLVTQPGIWEELIARGQYADRRRYESGVLTGRGVGL